MALSPQEWLQAELRKLYEYGEHSTYERSAQRILTGLAALEQRASVTLADALDQVGGS